MHPFPATLPGIPLISLLLSSLQPLSFWLLLLYIHICVYTCIYVHIHMCTHICTNTIFQVHFRDLCMCGFRTNRRTNGGNSSIVTHKKVYFMLLLALTCLFTWSYSWFFSLSVKQIQRWEETYLNSKMLTEFPEGNIRLTKLKSPTYTLPSGPEAKATGAKSLLLWAGPLQLVQATLLWCPLPIMVDMTGGCWEMNIFSPFPLCMIPIHKKENKN